MRIEQIRINGFKGIDLLEFEPKMINLVVGRNNTGKTSLLEAIDLLFNTEKIKNKQHLSSLINIYSQKSEVVSKLDNKKLSLELKKSDTQAISIAFKNELLKNLKRLEKFRKDLKFTEEMNRGVDRLLDSVMDPEITSKLSKESLTVIKDGNEEICFSSRSYELGELQYALVESISKYINKDFKLKIKPEMLYLVTHWVPVPTPTSETKDVIFIGQLRLATRSKREITPEEAIKLHIIEDHIKKYNLVENLEKFNLDFLLFKYNENIYAIPYDFMGEGFKAITGFLWYLSSKKIKDRIVLVEEPETYMHPGYIQELIKFIIKFSREVNIQFFITSHSIDFIESFFNENLSKDEINYLEREFQIIRMEKTKNYITSEVLDYKDAGLDKKKLLLDLRGI